MISKKCAMNVINSFHVDENPLSSSQKNYIMYFVKDLNKDIDSLNNLIRDYNNSSTEEKLIKINDISETHLAIIKKYPPEFGSQCSFFKQTFQIDLFDAIKEQRQLHNSGGAHKKDHNLIGKTRATVKEKLAPDEKTLTKEFKKLLNLNSSEKFSESKQKDAFNSFFGKTDKKKLNNYKLGILNYIKKIKNSNEPKTLYNQLIELRRIIQTALLEQRLESYRGKSLGILVALINKEIEKLEQNNPNLSSHPKTTDSNFPEILANMSTYHVVTLAGILADGKRFQQSDLFKLFYNDPQQKEFYDNSEISFLGGNNSKNFQITNKSNKAKFVLKIDNRLNAPKSIESQLINSDLRDTLTPIYAERQVTFTKNNKTITRTIMFTAFCEGGDLESHAEKCKEERKLASAANIYNQMAVAMEIIRAEECVLPDGKNTNWLIDVTGKVRIADTKSFLPAPGGFYNPKNEKCIYFGLLSSSYMNPPELHKPEGFNADQVHAFMLGKNLYQYLTGCDWDYLYGKNDASEFKFTASIFASKEGNDMADLIKNLIKSKPGDRMTVKNALNELQRLDVLLNPINTLYEPPINVNVSEKTTKKKSRFSNFKDKVPSSLLPKKNKKGHSSLISNHDESSNKIPEPVVIKPIDKVQGDVVIRDNSISPVEDVPVEDVTVDQPLINAIINEEADEVIPQPINNNQPAEPFIKRNWWWFRPALEVMGIATLTGIGAAIGGFAIPALGFLIAAGLGLSLGVTCTGLLRLISDDVVASACLTGAGSMGLGASIGAVLATFVFLGAGTAFVAGIGACVGLATFTIGAIATIIKRMCFSSDKKDTVEKIEQQNSVDEQRDSLVADFNNQQGAQAGVHFDPLFSQPRNIGGVQREVDHDKRLGM